MKLLTHEIFNQPECPEWAVSAFVSETGLGWWTDADDLRLNLNLNSFITRNTSARFALIDANFDTTNWPESLITRKTACNQ